VTNLTQAPRPPRVIHSRGPEPRPGGRRRGDAILIAFNHAYNEGDLEVAAQLLTEYQKINAEAPLLLTVDRRKRDASSAIGQMWARLRDKFAS
jgi:hypothetical protein